MPSKPSPILLWLLLVATLACAQQRPPASDSLSISTRELPKASLWEPYTANLQASGGIEPYHWHVVAGSVPRGFVLNEGGTLTGVLDEPGEYEFTVLVTDNDKPPKQGKQQLVLSAETPMTADWLRKAQVNGQRIEGSIKVSNHTGRDFDLTFIVLAVNDIGRATAIGYQHFPLKRDTRDMEIPFGDSLPAGNYVVNVDVVGEEPVSYRIFRARLVTGQESIIQGP
jgi:hypothetical protein